MVVCRVSDGDCVRNVLSSSGMARLCSGGLKPEAIDDVLASHEHLIFSVENDGEKRGFIAFTKMSESAVAIHVALRTIGSSTREAIRSAISMLPRNISEVVAIYPIDRVSLDRLCDDLEFKEVGSMEISGMPFSVKILHI